MGRRVGGEAEVRRQRGGPATAQLSRRLRRLRRRPGQLLFLCPTPARRVLGKRPRHFEARATPHTPHEQQQQQRLRAFSTAAAAAAAPPHRTVSPSGSAAMPSARLAARPRRRRQEQCDGWRRHALRRAPFAQLPGHCSHCRARPPSSSASPSSAAAAAAAHPAVSAAPTRMARRAHAAARGCDLLLVCARSGGSRCSTMRVASPRSRPSAPNMSQQRDRDTLSPAPLRILPRQAARQLLPAAAAANDAAALAARLRIHHPGQSPVRRLLRLRCRRIRRLLRQPPPQPSAARPALPAPHLPPQPPRSPLASVPDGAWTFDLSDASLSAWLGTLRWQPLRLVLQHTLLQATACFADRRFEVRRMAEQVLRPLVEVALWAEPPVLMQLWASFLPVVDSLACWVSASTLLLALQRCSAFEHLARRDDALTTRCANRAPSSSSSSRSRLTRPPRAAAWPP